MNTQVSMEKSSIQKLLNNIEKYIEKFENEKILLKDNNQNLGIIYTPSLVVDFIVTNIFRIFLTNLPVINKKIEDQSNIEEFLSQIVKSQNIKENINTTIKNIRILDPSCGSGRFLISIAEKLFNLHQILKPNLSEFDIKKAIIENNLFGIEIEESGIFISKLQLIKWLFSTDINSSKIKNGDVKNLKISQIDQIIENLSLHFNLFKSDFLLDFTSNKFDIIIGNPPYVENKKIKNIEFKKKLTKQFNSAYRLFDLSILFIEKAIELLKKEGYLSFILPNKFLSADYGIKIREILINQTEIKEIINVSSLPIFQNIATYPIILSLKKAKKCEDHNIKIKIFEKMNELLKNSKLKSLKLNQNLISKIPSNVIPISGNIDLINYLFKKYKTFAETFEDLKIIYRPFGFLKYNKYFKNISDKPQSSNDLLLLGTGNVGKYHVKFKNRIKIAGNDLKISYFNYHANFQKIWGDLKSEKLIFREIAKNLTCCYDPGVFTNITGLYFINIPSFNTEQFFSLLTILNSRLLDSVFKTLFGTLHMAGGYLRFNGSFIKRLPMPRKFPPILSQMGKILQLLTQLEYDINTLKPKSEQNSILSRFRNKYRKELSYLLSYFNKLSNSLVNVLYLEEFYLNSKLDYNIMREMLDLKKGSLLIRNKFLIPQYNLENYKIFRIDELDDILIKITELYTRLNANKILSNQISYKIKKFFN